MNRHLLFTLVLFFVSCGDPISKKKLGPANNANNENNSNNTNNANNINNTNNVNNIDDLDGDGVPNGSDNCPNLANVDQRDDDNDSVGNACDSCPAVANIDQTIALCNDGYDFLRDTRRGWHPRRR